MEAMLIGSPDKLLVSFFSGRKHTKKIYIISGESGSGKTLWCMRLFHEAKSRNLDVKGLVSIPVYERDVKTGFNLQNLESGLFKPLGFKNIKLDGLLPVGSWNFDNSTIKWGNQILGNIQNCQLLIIDELGPLEFVDKGGLQKAIEILDSNRYEKAIVVVRPSLLDQATSIWPSAEVIHIPEREMPA